MPKASWNFLSSEAASPMPGCDGIATQWVPSPSCISNKALQAPLYRTVKLHICVLSVQIRIVPYQLVHSSPLKYTPVKPRIISR